MSIWSLQKRIFKDRKFVFVSFLLFPAVSDCWGEKFNWTEGKTLDAEHINMKQLIYRWELKPTMTLYLFYSAQRRECPSEKTNEMSSNLQIGQFLFTFLHLEPSSTQNTHSWRILCSHGDNGKIKCTQRCQFLICPISKCAYDGHHCSTTQCTKETGELPTVGIKNKLSKARKRV